VKANGRITYYSDQTIDNVYDFLVSSRVVKTDFGNPDIGKRRQLEDAFKEMIATRRQPMLPVDL
jgi:hypothetical protein